MQSGRAIHGATLLAFDAVENITDIVEGFYRNISATPLPFGEAPGGSAPGIAGLVHQTIRGVNGGVRTVADLALRPLSTPLDRVAPAGPQREAAVAALNGVCGDHLERSDNPLAIPMAFRVFLPSQERPDPLEDAVDAERAITLQTRDATAGSAGPDASDFRPTGRILLLAHGLCMNDRHWSWQGHNHARQVAERFGYTPVYLRYNSGRHISTNGGELAEDLQRLIDDWPVPVESLTVVGFSMGGLVLRSALHRAERDGRAWLRKVDRAVYVCSPHHGSAVERGGYWLQKSLGVSPYTAPLTALGRLRSDGITDLRHGNLLEDDWRYHDAHADHRDRRRPAPLAEGIEHHAIAATLSKHPGNAGRRLRSDGLVHPSSALGRHREAVRRLDFAPGRVQVLHGQNHLGMLSDPRVSDCLQEWLAR